MRGSYKEDEIRFAKWGDGKKLFFFYCFLTRQDLLDGKIINIENTEKNEY